MTHISRRRLLQGAGALAVGSVALPGLVRAQSKELVIGCAGSHTAWMEQIVAPHMRETIGAEILFEGTKSSVNLEKMASNRSNPYLSVVQMDDPVMIQAVEEELLRPMNRSAVPNLADLREGTIHMDGMWANYVQPWAGVAYNTNARDGVASWSALWSDEAKGKVIIPSLQNTEGMWTLFAAAMLATGKPFSEAQYETDAAFAKLEELKPNILTTYSIMSQAFNLLEQGEITMLSGNFSSYTLPRKAEGVPVDLAAPKEGIFAMPSGICLVKDGPNPELADAYVNEMLGADLQAKIAEFATSVPANTKVDAGSIVPSGVPIHSPDWAFVSSNRREWIERFDKLMAG
ncbi:extracellular solute-binding protein [Jiella pelagia]|uniref:Extracellular solute-binding protein n=1 Tax=Jiella pelagia TaxID=2986949 RepID=A0ABY7BVN6_9HYPH|nr:extracellular solute-binding protein [Jiella pelagia]WAP67713.1 extracellular solute-binding protein [Jiella pelagia]